MALQTLPTEIIFALDQSTAKTGFAVFANDVLAEYGCHDPSGDYLERIVKLKHWFLQRIVDLKDLYPKANIHVLIEEIQLQKIPGTSQNENVLTFKKLAYVQGMLILLCVEHGISYEIVPSSSWKSICGIKGANRTAQKKDAQRYLKEKYNLNVIQDTCDAICIGESYNLQKKKGNWGI